MHQLTKTCVTRVSPQHTRGDPIKTGSRKAEKKPGIMTLSSSRFVCRENPAPAISCSTADVFLRRKKIAADIKTHLSGRNSKSLLQPPSKDPQHAFNFRDSPLCAGAGRGNTAATLPEEERGIRERGADFPTRKRIIH